MKNKFLEVHISDLEHMGAELVLKKRVEKKLLSVKYEGSLRFESNLYYVYVRHSFMKGLRLSGIAAPLYRNREYAILACQRLNAAYSKALQNNENNIHKKRRKRIWTEIALVIIAVIVMFSYLQRAVLVAHTGMSSASFVLSILYPVIMALCYIVHYRLQ